MTISPLECIDFYKADHRRQYPEGTTMVYSNLTARSAKLSPMVRDGLGGPVNGTIFFGLQHFIRTFLMDSFSLNFFQFPIDKVVSDYKAVLDAGLGKDAVPVDHIVALHKLGYLPIEIRALYEGQYVPIGVPMLTIQNTHPDFFWLTNYLETVISASLWKPITSATIAFWYRVTLEGYAKATGSNPEFVKFQAHDFSCRGMSGIEDAALSGAAHLTSFYGTDTVPALRLLRESYAGGEEDILGCSVPATEHSVMSMGGSDDEIGTFRRLITELYPSGIVSIVSDTWDFWRVLSEYAVTLKPQIVARDGKVVFRPDSGDPFKIVCGDPHSEDPNARAGAIQLLWDTFGGTVNAKGYKVLDPHVGLIYGDSITPRIMTDILNGLMMRGFASENIVFGVGSYTYNYTTRDTFGMAMKATAGTVNGELREIFKDPKTVSGVPKKSHRGLLRVLNTEKGLEVVDRQQSAGSSMLDTVFHNGVMYENDTLGDIRELISAQVDAFIKKESANVS